MNLSAFQIPQNMEIERESDHVFTCVLNLVKKITDMSKNIYEVKLEQLIDITRVCCVLAMKSCTTHSGWNVSGNRDRVEKFIGLCGRFAERSAS